MASTKLTRQLLGGKPEELGHIDDLEAGHYFEVPQPVVRSRCRRQYPLHFPIVQRSGEVPGHISRMRFPLTRSRGTEPPSTRARQPSIPSRRHPPDCSRAKRQEQHLLAGWAKDKSRGRLAL